MGNKLFVGNINWNASKEDLEDIFKKYGEIEEAILVKDEQGRSKGFGFITYVNSEDAENAKDNLNGFEIDGRALFVNEARPKER